MRKRRFRPADETIDVARRDDVPSEQDYGPPTFVLAASFEATAAELVAWDESPVAAGAPHAVSSRWRSRPPADVLAICYFDGPPSTKQGGPPGAGSTPRPLSTAGRWVVVVGPEGSETLIKIGDQADVVITRRVP
jgi:hypothetical protein